MIIDVLFYIIGGVLHLISTLFGGLSLVIPDWLTSSISTGVGYLGYLQGVLPLVPNTASTGLAHSTGILTIIQWVILFELAFYGVEIILWIFSHLPFFPKHAKLPAHAQK